MESEEDSGPVFCAPPFPVGLGGSCSSGGLSHIVVVGLGDTPDHFEGERGNDLDLITARPIGSRLQPAENHRAEVRGECGRVTRGHRATVPALSRSLASSYPPDG